MNVVLDTNVLARGSISRGTAVSAIIDAWRLDRFILIVSAHILDELNRTLSKPYFARRLSADQQAAYQLLLSSHALVTRITATVQRIANQPADDLVLATAVSAGASYLVTRDRKLLEVGSYGGVTIVSPQMFLDQLSSPASED